MEFRQLEYLLALYEYKSFASAADRVSVTYGALIHFLNKLEKEIGTELFLRTNSGLIPTAIGEKYIAMAKEMLEVYNNHMKKINDDYSQIAGSLSYAAIPPAVDDFHTDLVGKLSELFPTTVVIPRLFSSDDAICQDVVNGTADIGLTCGNCSVLRKSLGDILSFDNYVEEHFIFITPKDMPLPAGIDPEAHGVIDIHLFDDVTFYSPVYGDSNDKLYKAIGAPPKMAKVPTGPTGYKHVRRGHGVAIIMPSCVADPNAVNWFRIEPKIYYRNYTVFRKNDSLTKAERAFVKFRSQSFYERIAWAGQGK